MLLYFPIRKGFLLKCVEIYSVNHKQRGETMVKKPKKKKIDSLPKVKRRLFKLWSLSVRERAGHKCEFCGIEKGSEYVNAAGKTIKTKIDAHHLLSRDVKDCPLKFDIMNSVAVCPFHHKFGIPSFHRDPITTITWLQANEPERYEYVLSKSSFKVDLDNRKVLEEIENRLKENLPLDFEKLKEIEEEFPRKKRVKVEPIKGNMFDEFESEEPIPTVDD